MQPVLGHTLQFLGGPRPRGAAKVRLSLVIDPADQSALRWLVIEGRASKHAHAQV